MPSCTLLRNSLYILPPQNKFAYSQGDVTTSSERIEVTKVISSDLEFMAPSFVRLLRNSQPLGGTRKELWAITVCTLVSDGLGAELRMQLEEMNSMLAAWKANASASRYDIACQWVESNPHRWRSWIPDPTVCSRGQGLYNEGGETFTATRESATTCRACPPGIFPYPSATTPARLSCAFRCNRGGSTPSGNRY